LRLKIPISKILCWQTQVLKTVLSVRESSYLDEMS
jgi:hypothetical protein